VPESDEEAIWAHARKIKEAAQEELLKLPNVFGVGLGPKVKDGKWFDGPAIVVFTTHKQDVPPSNSIPELIKGIPTDVEQRESPKDVTGCPDENAKPFDAKKYRPLVGGVLIRSRDVLLTSVKEIFEANGTGGCLARIIDKDPDPDRQTVVMLTCYHVLVDACSLRDDGGQKVGQPTLYDCCRCSACCSDIFGYGMRLIPSLDVAAIALEEGVKWCAEIAGAKDDGDGKFSNASVRGSRTLTTLPPEYPVRKRGMKTGLRKGILRCIDMSPLAFDYLDCKVDPKNKLNLSLLIDSIGNDWMMCAGDSGSALLNEQDEVLGILSRGQTKLARASAIGDIIAAFKSGPEPLTLEIATADKLGQVHKAPKPKNAPAHQVEKRTIAIGGFGEVPAAMAARLTAVRDELTATEKGRAYAAVIERNQEEARELVNRNRRVATVWKRNGGPEIVHAALAVVQQPEARLPETIAGKPFRDCIRRIAAIFSRYASPSFAADIARCEDDVARLGGTTYGDLVSALA